MFLLHYDSGSSKMRPDEETVKILQLIIAYAFASELFIYFYSIYFYSFNKYCMFLVVSS